ncbi:MAG: hypothetical protein GX180_10020 [Enterococcus sp.]|nr:hypothetical protein [Enterococcus sp.]
MKLEIDSLLEKIGLPYAYHSFNASRKKAIPPPYIVYVFTGTQNIKADNRVRYKVDTYRLELYTSEKLPSVELQIENVLEKHYIPWDKSEVYIDDQSMFEIIYDIDF